MGKRKPMSADLLSGRNAGQALNLVTGIESPPLERKPAPRKKSKPAAAPAEEKTEPRLFRVTPSIVAALMKVANARAEERGSMRPDSSEVLREVLFAWMAEQ